MPAARRYDRVMPVLDIGDFAEFVDGCSCGDPLDHDPDCSVIRPKINNKSVGRPSDETLSYRRSILQGVDLHTGKPLGRQGWITAVEEAETAAFRRTWLAGLTALRNKDCWLRGKSPGVYGGMGAAANRLRSAECTQWIKTLLASVRDREVLSDHDLARIRADTAFHELTESWDSNGFELPMTGAFDLIRIDDSTLAFRAPVEIEAMTYQCLTFRKWIARWLHITWVAYPHYRDVPTVAGVPIILIVVQAHASTPTERPPTRFVQLPESAVNDEVKHTVAHRLQETTNAFESHEVYWPAERMVAGLWMPLCVKSTELDDFAGQIRTGGAFEMELLGSLAQIGNDSPEPQSIWTSNRQNRSTSPPRHFAWTNDPSGERKLRASVAVRERSAKILRGLDSLTEGSTKSTLLVAESLCSSSHITAVTLPVSGIGKRWKPVIHRRAAESLRIAWDKSMAVWFNSTLGVLSLLASGGDPADPYLTDESARWMPVPVFSTRQTETLAQVHDAHCSTALLRIAEADHDPVRLALDEAVCRALGCDATEVSQARRLLAAEPLFN